MILDVVVTGMTERLWNPWGASWCLSLKNLAKTEAHVKVVDLGLTQPTRQKIQSFGFEVVDGQLKSGIRSSTLSHVIPRISAGDRFCFFDFDIWFNGPVDSAFALLKDKIVVCQNLDHGFLGLTKTSGKNLAAIGGLLEALGDPDTHKSIHENFDAFFIRVEDKYNVISLPDIEEKDGVLTYFGDAAVGIHPTGIFKQLPSRKRLLFHERHRDMFDEHVSSRRIVHMSLSKSQKF